MAKVSNIVPITDLRQDAAAVLRKVRAQREPFIITQRGRPAAVVVSVAEFERHEEEREILRLLVQGDREIARGKGHDLDAVFREADALLKRD
ncbi:MAG: type II toxin-antitoxin system Phd/YefM family antitoxin [Deltaproteobacteria bacterium]|nr:type II toxin-antitoxin system Phd/YefM family antitoxin [Deltaproteobacteria bacterium]